MKKFLDANGVAHLGEILDEYPNNQILATVIDAISDELDEKASTSLATTSSSGLMSATDKAVLDNLNPNVAFEINPLTNFVYITNAKQENMLNCLMNFEPQIGTPIATSNLLDVSDYTPGYYISSNGSNSTNANDNLGPFIPVTPGQDIYYTGIIGATNSSSINRRLHVYSSNQTWIKQMSFAGSLKVGDHWSTHATVPSNGAYIRVSWGVNDTNVMISIGAPVKYEPYRITPYIPLSTAQNPGTITLYNYTDSDMLDGQSYSITLPAAAGSIYACKVDPVRGTLIVTSSLIDSYNGETLPGLWYSDRDKYAEGATPTIGAQVVYILDENDYEEYEFTPLIIPMNYHNNYIYCEDGTFLSLIYYAETLAVSHITLRDGIRFGYTDLTEENVTNWNNTVELIDTKANIDSPEFTGSPLAPNPGPTVNSTRIATTQFVQNKMANIAPVEPNYKASKSYNAGEYLMYNGQLYKTTTAIASGVTLTAGSNIEATDVATELNLLFASI